jgi:beta-phosphoglucomutase-like phosphatase (HAD superfamily)
MIRALIFDFDGLILETEGPSYQSWVEVYQSFGQVLPFSTWSTTIGTTQADFNPRLELERLVTHPIDWDLVEALRQAKENALIVAQSILPGVAGYLKDAYQLGLKIGLASSSSRRWVSGHLTRLGILDRFDCICAAEDVVRVKPDPELYLAVLRRLGLGAGEAVALEDSPLGIRSAKAAGIFCVAVPNPLTRNLPLDEADLRLGSLAELPLPQLLEVIAAV